MRIVRRGTGSVVTWRRAQMVLLSAQTMDVAAIAKVAFTSEDWVRDVIRNFNADGFSSLYPRYKGGRPPKFTLPQRREIKKIAKSHPADHSLPFSTWSLSKLAEFLVAEGVVDDISHEDLRIVLGEEGVSFQRLKTWKASGDPHYRAKKARVEHLYAIADREVTPDPGDPEIIFCVDEFGPLNLQPRPGRAWAAVSGKHKQPGRAPRRRMRATYRRTAGVRHLFAAYELREDKLYGHIKPRMNRARFLEFCRYLVRRYAAAGLDEAARRSRRRRMTVGAVDETGQGKQGAGTAGVKRQYMGCAGRVANGINTVHLSYARERTGHALVGARQWIPAEDIASPVKSLVTGLPLDLRFRTKGQLAIDVPADAYGDGLSFDFACGDEVYGSCTELREFLEVRGQAYVLRVASSFIVAFAPGMTMTCADAVLDPRAAFGACHLGLLSTEQARAALPEIARLAAAAGLDIRDLESAWSGWPSPTGARDRLVRAETSAAS